ncbi:MAG: four helix bundle protein [Bacteroidota bacterium]
MSGTQGDTSNKAKSFQDLRVWQKAHQLTLAVYRLTKTFPKEELFGLTSQIRRAAVSVPANIAEGFRKVGKADKARFMNISQGSLDEVHYYFILAKDLGYADPEQELNQLDEVSRMLQSYVYKIKQSI